jgi:hypothetical protein
MDHLKLSDELRQKLIESAAWGKAGVETRLDEGSEVIEEKKSMKGMKGKKAHPDEAQDKALIAKMMKKKMKEEEAEHDDEEDAEELAEELHICPLCTSQLEESIDEDRILEHLDVVMGLVERLSQLQEGEEDVESVIDHTLAELLLLNDEEDTLSEDTEDGK